MADSMTEQQEDEILASAAAIKSRLFKEAEAKWLATPDTAKMRPWPRCQNITCNRTLICQDHCHGFDY